MRANVKKYIQGYDIYINNKAQRYKPYGSLQSLSILTNKWKDLRMDFLTSLLKSKNWRGVKYDSIFIITDQLTKMVNYELVLTTLDDEQLVEVLIETVIKYHGLPDFIITD